MQTKIDLKDLQRLGLTDRESRVYYTLVVNGPNPIHEITAATAIPRAKIYENFRKLLQLGLIVERTVDGKKLYEAVRPDDAMSHLISCRAEEMEQYHRTAAKVSEELMAVFESNCHTFRAQDYFTFLQNPEQIRRYLEELQRKAQSEVLWFNKAPDFLVNYPSEWTFEALRRGVRYREIVEVDQAMNKGYLQAQVFPYLSESYESRIHPSLAVKLIVFDGRTSLFQFVDEDTPPHRTTIVIENRGIAIAFATCFEKYWQESIPLDDFLRNHPA
jgi:sugar-specific transcriptional regulator TrmB